MKKSRLTLLCVFLAINTAFAADFTMTDDWHLNDLLRQLELRGEVGILRGIEPFYVSDVLLPARDSDAKFWSKRTKRLLEPFAVQDGGFILWTPGIWGMNRSSDEKMHKFGKMRFGIGGTYKNWSTCGIYRMNSGYYSDPEYYGARWERVAGKADQVILRWSNEDYYFQMGRDYLRTGLGMVLAGAKPYERIQAGFKIGKKIRMTWFVSQLDEYVEYNDTIKTINNRFLAGHRIEANWRHFIIGFEELMLYGGVGRQIELYYLLPLYAFHGEQLNHRWNDNTMWSLDMKFVIPPFRLRAEGILDDLQIDRETTADREPALYGFAAQVDFAALNSPLFITPRLRYEQVRNRVFNQDEPRNRFLYENTPLGAKYGNDYDQILMGIEAIGSFYGGDIEFRYRRKGVGRIDSLWTTPWLDDPEWSENFPSGVVEKRTGIQWSIWADGLNWDFGQISFQTALGLNGFFEQISNMGHIKGESGDEWELKAEIETRIWGVVF